MLRSSIILTTAQGLGLVLSLLASVVVARALGPADRGALAWMMTVQALGLHMSMLGADALLRRLPAQQPHLRPVLLANSRLQAWLPLVLHLPLAWWAATTLHPELSPPLPLLLVLLALPFLTQQALVGSLALGMGSNRPQALVEVTQRGIATALTLLLFAGGLLTLPALAAATLAVAVASSLLAARLVGRLIPATAPADLHVYRSHTGFMARAFAASLAMVVFQRLDIAVLAGAAPAATVGHYAVAMALVDTSLVAAGVVGLVLQPMLATPGADHTRVYRMSLLAVLGIYTAGAALGWLLAPWLVPWLFGNAYAPAVPLLQVLLLYGIGMSGLLACQGALSARGNGWLMLLPVGFGLATKLALLLALGTDDAVQVATISAMSAALALALGLALSWSRASAPVA